MDFNVDKCRRRPDCSRLLIYFDTSTYRRLARGEEGSDRLREVLSTSLKEERAICVGSPWLDDEAAILQVGPTLDGLIQTVRSLTLDVRMKGEEELIDFELYAAASAYCGTLDEITWEEAFRDDPDQPPLRSFQAQFLNDQGSFENRPISVEEAESDRATSVSLTSINNELRAAGFTWEEVASGNLQQQVRYLLHPHEDRRTMERAMQLENATDADLLTGSFSLDPGSAGNRYLRLAHVVSTAKRLRERFPAIGLDPAAFSGSDHVQYLPSLRLFSFLLAALSVDGRRRAQKSDLHDLRHLTYGLSRCDVVTADKRSCELARRRNLVPRGAHLFEAHDLAAIADAVADQLA